MLGPRSSRYRNTSQGGDECHPRCYDENEGGERQDGQHLQLPILARVAREDLDYVRARAPLDALSVGDGNELSVKYREMVIIGILAFRGSPGRRGPGAPADRRAAPVARSRP